MVRMINTQFGTQMWVAEDRVKEYQAAGHRLAADPDPEKPAKEPKQRKTVKK